jgi:hypothetical protein
MKRTLMMLVAVLALTAVASVQAADVKVEIKERDAAQNLVPAQNIKYSIANSDGAVVVDGEGSDIAFNAAEGNYELTVEQAAEQVRYGSAVMAVPAEGDIFIYEITDAGLVLIEEDDDDKAGVILGDAAPSVVPQPVALAQPMPCVPALPPQGIPTMTAGGNWGVLALVGALVATAVALGVDDDCPCCVTPVQR